MINLGLPRWNRLTVVPLILTSPWFLSVVIISTCVPYLFPFLDNLISVLLPPKSPTPVQIPNAGCIKNQITRSQGR